MKTIINNQDLRDLATILECDLFDLKEAIETSLNSDPYIEGNDYGYFMDFYEEDELYSCYAEHLQSRFNMNVNIHTIACGIENLKFE